jgi:outer membrane protein
MKALTAMTRPAPGPFSLAPLPATTRTSWGRVWRSGLLLAGVLGSAGAQAQSLQALYEAARAYDAAYLSALSQMQADRARAEQAKAGLRPSVSLSGGASWSHNDSSLPNQDRTSNGQRVVIEAKHPLYRPASRIANEQAQKSLTAAEARLQSAEQDLLLRTAQGYFDVLAAQDNLTFVKAQKTAVAEQLAAAKRNFEVGTSTITDTREAQARFDLVTAQEIAAENELRVKRLALDQLVGQPNTTPWKLSTGKALPEVSPTGVDAWVARAENEHPSVKQAITALDIARLEIQRAESDKSPTINVVAEQEFNRGAPQSGPLIYSRNHKTTLGVQFNMPLYTGGAVQNRVAETLALQDKARQDLDAARRNIAQATRAAYFGVVSGQGQVKALEAAEASSQSALEANQLGYQVGVRINIDVLNAQSQLFQTKASLAKARYDVLVGGLRLKQVSGVLKADDLQPINALLQQP